jgi:cytochrome P450
MDLNLVEINLNSSVFKANPFPFYTQLRNEAPVCRVSLSRNRYAWLVTRYEDVTMALKDERLVKNKLNALTPEQLAKQPWTPRFFKPLTRNMLYLDVPDHTRLRALVHKAFTPRLIEQMRMRVQTISEELLDTAQKQGHIDLILDYALPIPTVVIADMLGVPAADQHKFHRWSNALVSSNQTGVGTLKMIPHVLAFLSYIRKLIKAKRAEPQDDLTSALVQVEDAGEQLSEDELVAMIFLLLVAGHETTVNLIGNGMLALLQHPDQMQALRQEPSLIRSAVEELLRFDSPVAMATDRYAREDVTMAGVTIPRGELVYAVLASANRDERQFLNPDSLDLKREPNKHVAFGNGIHYCLGAPLARMEGQIAINALLCRLPNLRLAVPPEKLRWRRGVLLHSLENLPVAFA